MNKKVKVIKLLSRDHIKEVCRCCLSKDTPNHNIFDLSHDHTPFVDIFSQLLVTYVNSNDDLPKKICNTCLTQVLRFYNFKSNFHKVKTVLSTIISKNSQKSNVPIKIEISKENDINPKIQEEEPSEQHVNQENHDDITIKEEPLDIKNILPENNPLEPEGELHTVIRPFYCKYCDRYFTKNGYSKHCKPYECNICQIIFTEQCSLQTHQLTHSDKKPYLCEYCGMGFISRVKMNIHQVTHTGDKPFMCEQCGAKYKSRNGLLLHKNAKHNGNYTIGRKKSLGKRFNCNLCGMKLSTKQSVQNHLRTMHSEKNLNCVECKMDFSTPLRYCNHFERFHGEGRINKLNENNTEQYKCEKCDKVYSKREILNNHVLANHTNKKPSYKCVICYKTFTNTLYLKVHLNIHSGETTAYHVCKDCPKKFLHKTSLEFHRRLHTGKNTFDCKICGRKFAAKHHYKGHLRSHAGDKPFKCSYCDKSYSHSSVLTQHLRVHTGERPYKCVQCPKKFYLLSSFKKHKQLKHSELTEFLICN